MTRLTDSPILAAVEGYADRGFYVLPCQYKDKRPMTVTGHGLNFSRGALTATADVEKVRQCWGRWPGLNVGIAVEPSELVVLDLDSADSRAWLIRMTKGKLTGLVAVRTGRTLAEGYYGIHVYFRQRPEWRLSNMAPNLLGPGVQVKADGYVMAPPSVHPSGARYLWWDLALELPAIGPPAEVPLAPGWLLKAAGPRGARTRRRRAGHRPVQGAGGRVSSFIPPRPSREVVAHALRTLATARPAGRNNTAHWCAHRLRDALDAPDVLPGHTLGDYEADFWTAADRCGIGRGSGLEGAKTARTWRSVVIDRACCGGSGVTA